MTSVFRSAASDLLATTAPVAWEEHAARRTLDLVQQFAAGQMDERTLRGALGTARESVPAARPAKGVAVVSLVGVLTPGSSLFTMLGAGTSVREFMRQLSAAAQDPTAKAIVVAVDSPGGYIGMIPEAAALMRTVSARKAVVVAVTGMNASAAYWISAGATTIEATPSAEVGSIGVYVVRVSIARQLEREGVDVEVFSAGRHKAEGLAVRPITDDERQATAARVEHTYTLFVNDVASGRHRSVGSVRDGFGQGRVVTAADAVRLGMIDRVALLDETLARAVQGHAQACLSDEQDRYRYL